MREGIATGVDTFVALQSELGWSPSTINKTICHQVGATHRKLMLEQLGLAVENDFATFETLGNTGSVALPISLAKAAEAGHLARGDQVALMGIGSGINCVMLGLDWQAVPSYGQSTLGGRDWSRASAAAKSRTIQA